MNSKNHFKKFTDEQIENLLKQAYRNVMDRYYTEDEVRKMFLDAIKNEVSYWSKQKNCSEKERCDGLIHSVLCIIDGVSSQFPSAITLMAEGNDSDLSECPDKKIRAGQTFNLHTMLHESYYND